MKKFLSTLTASCLILSLYAQNIFPNKLDNCVLTMFCLDCGDEKANVDTKQFDELVATLNKKNNYAGISGKIMLQVLVDSVGNGCVLSHTDNSKSAVTLNIIKKLNDFRGWIPAKTAGKPESKTSINLSMQIQNGVLTGKIERVDMDAFKKSFDRPGKPEIFNKNYVYKNEHLQDYTIQVWNSKNSNLPNNFNDDILVDKDNVIWMTVDNGLVRFDGKQFSDAGQNITPKGTSFDYHAIACDNDNNKWAYGKENIYSFNNKTWALLDSKTIGIKGAYKIINNAASGEVFFCSDQGLTIYKHGEWSNLNKDKIKELPSNRVDFAKRDSKNRIWIGTFSGSVLIDGNQVTSFNETDSVLKGECITSMDEDENGNIYLGLYEFDRKDPKEVNSNEGIAIQYTNGFIRQFTTANSGMPFNHVTKVLYDKNEKVLWIATDRAGLVRYDLQNGWENYHNDNSAIPTAYISDMAFDNSGILYLATRQGLVKIEKKSK